MAGNSNDPADLPSGLLPATSDRDAARRRPRMMVRVFGFAALLGLIALGIGFAAFLGALGRQETEFGRTVDGIAALTGGADRIGDAMSVLREGRAKRLLITGVNASVSNQSLIRAVGNADLFHCCVDVGREALNTVGNAKETALWAARNGYRTVMVVTSNYHMPRALVELRRHLKQVEFIPHPVMSEAVRTELWWRDPALLRLLLVEYGKYLAAELRSRVVPDNPVKG